MSKASTRSVRVFTIAVLALGTLGAALANPAPAPAPPVAVKRPVTNEYHGVKIVDDYQWLETDGPEVDAWDKGQVAHARAILDAIPAAAALRARLTQLMAAPSVDYGKMTRTAGIIFAEKLAPPKDQPVIVTLTSPDDVSSEKVVLDPTVLDPTGHTAIDFFVPSPDGKKVAASISKLGSEAGDLHVFDVATGKDSGDVVPNVNKGTGGGDVTWSGDGTGYWYTRYPRGQERPPADVDFYLQIWFHKLGTPTDSDTYALGKDFPRIAEIKLNTSPDGRFVVARVANGDGGQYAYYLHGAGGNDAWTQISTYDDQIVNHEFGRDGALYLLSHKDAPRGKVLRLAPGETSLAKAATLVPQSDGVVAGFQPTATKLYVTLMLGGPDALYVVDLDGKEHGQVPIPQVSSVKATVALDGDDFLFYNESYTAPGAWFRYGAQGGAPVKTKLARTNPADFSDFETVREVAASKDGTPVPMSIVRKKGTKLDGKNPVLLTAYGAYGLARKPRFSPATYALLEQGFVFVEANIRGGGEFGEAWHLGGNLTHKQNDYDDFHAVAKHLVDAKYTTPKRLGILGGSNGGLLMGVQLTQHPEMYGAVVAIVGLYDQLRTELESNGAFNITEFGTVKDEAQFKAMYGYSPYQHVVDGRHYPPVLFLTGAHDKRVAPWQSRKMTARMQAATGGKSPVLLRINPNGGHGVGGSLSDRIDEATDEWAFLFAELGVPYKPVAAAETHDR